MNPEYRATSEKYVKIKNSSKLDFPGGIVDMNLPTNAEDMVQSLVWEDPTWHRTTVPQKALL